MEAKEGGEDGGMKRRGMYGKWTGDVERRSTCFDPFPLPLRIPERDKESTRPDAFTSKPKPALFPKTEQRLRGREGEEVVVSSHPTIY